MTDQNSVPEKTNGSANRLDNRFELFHVIKVGALICVLIGIVDNAILSLATSWGWNPIVSWLAFITFVVQTILISLFVGKRVGQHFIWWGMFLWSHLFVNLELILIQFNSRFAGTSGQNITLVYAFYAAQIGLVCFWGILGAMRWQIRIPLAAIAMAGLAHPFYVARDRQWHSILLAYWVAILAMSLILLAVGFRLRHQLPVKSDSELAVEGQFSIKHLFVWTTIVAFLFGIGRLVNWFFLFNTFILVDDWQSFSILTGRVMLMTPIGVVTIWVVMGRRNARWSVIRYLLFFVVLLLVAYCLYVLDSSQRLRWRSVGLGWRGGNPSELLAVWCCWTFLNGLFLAGLILVFRVSGCIFTKVKKRQRGQPLPARQQ